MPINQELRKPRMCPSEAGAIFGVHPYLDLFGVWARHKADLPELPPSTRMMGGHFFESGILNWYAHVTKFEVEHFDQTLVNPDLPWLAYTPDALIHGQRRGVDAKLIAWTQRRLWGYEADEVPEYIRLQVWCYMAAMDLPVYDVAAVIGDELRIIPIPRPPAHVEQTLLTRMQEFHQRFILGDERPEMGASVSAARWLQTAFPQHKRPDLRHATPEEIVTLTEYARVRFEQAALKERRATLENLIKAAIAEREGLIWTDGKFTWRRTKDSKEIDWQSLALALLTHHHKDDAERLQLIADYTRPKPGYRKIRFEHDDLPSEESVAA